MVLCVPDFDDDDEPCLDQRAVRPKGSCHLPLEHDRALLPERLLASVDVDGGVLDLVADRLCVLAGHAFDHLLHGNWPATQKNTRRFEEGNGEKVHAIAIVTLPRR